jgi:hypothetical protein
MNWKMRTAATFQTSSSGNQLGVGSFIGDEVWDQQRFSICVGPVGLERFKEFLPESPEKIRWLDSFFSRAIHGFRRSSFSARKRRPYFRLDDEGFRSQNRGSGVPSNPIPFVLAGWAG